MLKCKNDGIKIWEIKTTFLNKHSTRNAMSKVNIELQALTDAKDTTGKLNKCFNSNEVLTSLLLTSLH